MTMPARPSATSARASRLAAAFSEPVSRVTRVPAGSPSSSPARPSGPSSCADAAGVLGGEHLGGREQRGLAAGVDDLGHGPQRDDGLARADLALQQPVHRLVAVELGGELLPHLALALGERRRAGRRRRRRAGRRSARGRAMPGSRAAARRRAARVSWRISASSHFSRWRGALDVLHASSGRWMSSSAAASESSPCRARISSGSGSSTRLGEAAAGAEQQLHRLLDHPAGDVLARRVDRAPARGPSRRRRRRRRRAGACRGGRTASRPRYSPTVPANMPQAPTLELRRAGG